MAADRRPPQEAKGPSLHDAVERALRTHLGDGDAQRVMVELEQQAQRRMETQRSQAQARAVSAGQVAKGQGGEMDADARPPPRVAAAARQAQAAQLSRPQSSQQTKPLSQRSRSKRAETKQAKRQVKKLAPFVQSRQERDRQREIEQADAMADKALQSHGIRHHYRPLPKLAFHSSYAAGEDRNGTLALQILKQISLPKARLAQVLQAAYRPKGYTPRRNVYGGQRSEQQPYRYDGREFGRRKLKDERVIDRPGWEDGQREVSHPGAIKVIQCAVFLWLSKSRTRRTGYTYVVRGFGRGVLTSICQCGTDALVGHTDGMPGALRALEASGFLQYGQPPAEKVTERDRGPSGHAYNVYWFLADADAVALEALHARIAYLGRLPVLARLLQDPALIEERAQGPPAPPPVVIDPADIPF